jgi:hypothetical protein
MDLPMSCGLKWCMRAQNPKKGINSQQFFLGHDRDLAQIQFDKYEIT